MISSAMVTKIFVTLMGCYALGYGVGIAMLWVNRIRSVS